MNTVSSQSPYKSRLMLKLILTFLAALLLITVGGLALDLFSGYADAQKIQSEMSIQQPAVPLDPKLESELAKVLDSDNLQTSADLKDPFTDHSGISGRSNATVTSSITRNSATPESTTTNNQSPAKTTAATTPKSPNLKNKTNNVQSSGIATEVIAKEKDTLTRILERDNNIRLGIPVGQESEVFAIEDLLPVGEVSGGSGQTEVLLYSQSADRTFSYGVGTRFYDGWIVEIRPEGVVFGFGNRQERRLKSWVRSIQPRSTINSTMASPNQLVREGN